MPTPARCTSGSPTSRSASGRPRRPESYLRIDAILDAATADRRRGDPSGLRVPRRAGGLRASRGRGGADLHRSDGRGDRGARRQARRPAARPERRGRHGAGDPRRRARSTAPMRCEAIVAEAAAIGFPLLVKAAAGGGGRGMRRVERPADLPAALAAASAEAASGVRRRHGLPGAGGPPGAPRRGPAPRRRDGRGRGDRRARLLDPAPAPEARRGGAGAGAVAGRPAALHDRAVRIATAAGLTNAATAEFLLEPDGAVWFLEVNTRLQVEHGVTELVSGLDIVREQLWLAAGRPLSPAARDAAERAADPTRHAIEVRLTAEDPGRGFAPTPGTIRHWAMPSGTGVRVDTAGEAGARVPPEYDNLMAKVMVVADDRPAAIDRLRLALDETEVAGIQTTLPFHRFVARDPAFRDGGALDRLGRGALGRRGRARGRAVVPRPLARGSRPSRRWPRSAGPGPDRLPGTPTAWRAAARADGDRPVAPMRRQRVTDRTTGDDPRRGGRRTGRCPDAAAASRRRARARASITARLEVVVDGWRFELVVEDAARAALRDRATSAAGRLERRRAARHPCHHPGTGRLGGRRRRATPSRRAAGCSRSRP